MFKAFWNLNEVPFRNEFRRNFYFASASHQAAFLKLRYALEQRLPAALLVGPAGTGKTFVSRLLIDSSSPKAQPVVFQVCLFDEAASLVIDLAETLAPQSGEGLSGQQAFRRVQEFLRGNLGKSQHALLVLDNAQVLQHHQSWEILRNLMTLDIEGQIPWTVLVIGQPRLLALLENLPHIEELLALKCLLRPLSPEEVSGYVRHCLLQAGTSDDVFTSSALELIAQESGGIPRRINRLCDLSMLIAYAEKSRQVQVEHVEAVVEELAGIPVQ